MTGMAPMAQMASSHRGFVEAMGGALRLESPIAHGRGARFVFRLPLAGEPAS